jgi:FkbM family methyltransferase
VETALDSWPALDKQYLVSLRSPRGNPVQLWCREGTSDLSTAGSVFADVAASPLVDEYDLASLTITGHFLDIGGHIGTVAIAVLIDNPEATASIVEPLPENAALIRLNLEANGLTDRAQVFERSIGSKTVAYGSGVHRFIGNIAGPSEGAVTVPALRLSQLLPAQAMKLDCEGCEWKALADKRIGEVPIIFGEYHGAAPERLHALLDKTHEVTVTRTSDGFGLFRAVGR